MRKKEGLSLIDLETNRPVSQLPLNLSSSLTSLHIASDGIRVAVHSPISKGSMLDIWDILTNKLLSSYNLPWCVFSPFSYLLWAVLMPSHSSELTKINRESVKKIHPLTDEKFSSTEFSTDFNS